MISLTTTAHVVQQMRKAQRAIEFSAYILRSGQIVQALQNTVKHGAHVRVQLEAHPYADSDGKLAKINRDAVSKLRRAGVHAQLADVSGQRGMHMKAAIVDGMAFLDDRNWPADRRNIVIADDDRGDVHALREALHGKATPGGALALTKGRALARETTVLLSAKQTRDRVSVETESLTAGTAPYAAMKALARSGRCVRLLICSDDLRPAAIYAARALLRAGVDVRLTHAAEKIAVAGSRAWVGSANATYGQAQQTDWGLCLHSRRICKQLQVRFDSTWQHANALIA
ncbi:MAG: phosphatidylserine/phosphatidylglycerophosphate/cardiolipin synthase family protein [Candidatus Eremiobacteraeota bacterium]|nr:phosphatidylserine/phosphatidylglycerophosphate/cardiolipin synthase family protein [Candidatus Eremiobacteraeota bacterium]